jgi:hypothetical protein
MRFRQVEERARLGPLLRRSHFAAFPTNTRVFVCEGVHAEAVAALFRRLNLFWLWGSHGPGSRLWRSEGRLVEACWGGFAAWSDCLAHPLACRSKVKKGCHRKRHCAGVFRTALNAELLDNTPRGREFLMRTPMEAI